MTRGEAVNWIINISADIGKAEHRELWHYEQALLEIREMLESEPERKTGKWLTNEEIVRPTRFIEWHCSRCGSVVESVDSPGFKFCPNCGADMRETP